MLINFTNHPNKNWSDTQTAVASVYDEILDIPFPDVDPNGNEDYIEELADTYVSQINAHKPSAVLCQGEMTLAFAVASILMSECGVTVLAACSERIVSEITDGNGETVKQAEFRFARFRKYIS
jgi:hypothetical protein